MRTIALALGVLLSLCPLSMAQQSTSPVKTAQSIAENYVVTLTMTGKEQKASELSLVTASPDFNTSFVDAQSNVIKFAGTLASEEGDIVSVRYTLGGEVAVPLPPNGFTYKSVGTQATVRLKLGASVQILKSDAQTCTLKISRLSEQPASVK